MIHSGENRSAKDREVEICISTTWHHASIKQIRLTEYFEGRFRHEEFAKIDFLWLPHGNRHSFH